MSLRAGYQSPKSIYNIDTKNYITRRLMKVTRRTVSTDNLLPHSASTILACLRVETADHPLVCNLFCPGEMPRTGNDFFKGSKCRSACLFTRCLSVPNPFIVKGGEWHNCVNSDLLTLKPTKGDRLVSSPNTCRYSTHALQLDFQDILSP